MQTKIISKSKKLTKKPTAYLIAVLIFLCLSSLYLYFAINNVIDLLWNFNSYTSNQKIKTCAIVIFIFLASICQFYFWYIGIVDFVFWLFFWINRSKNAKLIRKIAKTTVSLDHARVLLLYCTCDDFNEEALIKSMQQNYLNYKTVILDDSKTQKFKDKIDLFKIKYPNVKVIRRETNIGYKAANINNYLKTRSDYDYFVLLDSDEIIPSNFITSCLKYFNYFTNVGVVQANHKGKGGVNDFQKLFSYFILPSLSINLVTKNEYGIVSLFGHGAMVSRQCYESTKNGFPELISEDNAFTIQALNNNFFVYFAPNIICEEDFPVNYFAFKKRQTKFINGNLQFNSLILKKEYNIKAPAWQRWNFLTQIGLVYLTIILGFLFLISTTVLVCLKSNNYKEMIIILYFSIFLMVAPWLKEILNQCKYIGIRKTLIYLVFSFLLMFSIFTLSLRTIISIFFGKKSGFIVTPKENKKLRFWAIIKYCFLDILVFLILVTVSVLISYYFAWQSIFIFLPFIFGSISSIIFASFTNINTLTWKSRERNFLNFITCDTGGRKWKNMYSFQ
ncbi:N-glycosyltransferase [Mycoplasmopsis californica]|nr:N-glycosyltransferase [Mycoplasmopsis californica]